jgi:hypothetical protein
MSMNMKQARDLVRRYLSEHGLKDGRSISGALIDQMLNIEMQTHFSAIRSQSAYWHALYQEAQDEYNLPDGLLGITILKVAGERYYPASYPYVEDAKNVSADSTTTDNGVTVNASTDRLYWIVGNKLMLHPAPMASMTATTSGACTVAGSTVTISTGSLGTVNSMKNALALVGALYYNITGNSTTAFTVDGTPVVGTLTYSIYKNGLQIWGSCLPAALTEGSTDAMPGNDMDAQAICLMAAINCAMSKAKKNEVNIEGLSALHSRLFSRIKSNYGTLKRAPVIINPYPMRTDAAGWR